MVHPDVAGFGVAADAYERGRPDYPVEVVTFLASAAGLGPGSVVVDLAAGTGKFTRLLHSALDGRGVNIVAVEPVAEMRAHLEASLPDVEAVDGTAESMPLPDGSADCVTAAQAFHWFANDEALAEIARVLRPNGKLALVWNMRDLTQPLQAEIGRLVTSYRSDRTPSHGSGKWRSVIDASPLFGIDEELLVPYVQMVSRVTAVDRVASTSFVALLPEDQKRELLAGVEAALPESAGEEPTVELHYVTEAFVCGRR
ncbi:MAG TPA: methyltransferase domain-containing protein [Acidimicrobiales bacterium]|nr:methyltransferase domain-containing protein [Acidimicrobiales bacterium]